MTSADFQRNRDNFCYRHPDRVSFVMCQRCLRTICNECQTQGPVGVICPECMREQAQGRTTAQKKAERRWKSRQSVAVAGVPVTATNILIAVTLLVGVLQLIPGLGVQGALMFWGDAMHPQVMQPWRALGYMLVHGSFWHIGLNLLSLFMIGRILEPMLGRGRFFTLYVLAGLGGAVAVSLLSEPGTPVIGASGAVFGLLGALMVIARRLGGDITGILILLGVNLVIGFIPGLGISWQAHVGGLVIGAAVGGVYALTRSHRRRALQITLLVALGVLIVAALFLIPILRHGV